MLSTSLFTKTQFFRFPSYNSHLDRGVNVRINAVDITSQLIDEHGLQEAYQVALNGVAEAVKSNDNYLLSVMHEVKTTLHSKIVEQINVTECRAS